MVDDAETYRCKVDDVETYECKVDDVETYECKDFRAKDSLAGQVESIRSNQNEKSETGMKH